MYSIEDVQRDRPVNRKRVDRFKKQMLLKIRAHALRELRESQEMTQVQLARTLQVSQNRVSRFENGDLEKTQIDTLRRYVEALGGELHVVAVVGEKTIPLA